MESQENIKKLNDLMEDVQFAMMTTISASDGSFASRPMTLQRSDFDGELWFFVGRDGMQVDDLAANPMVSLTFANPKGQVYVAAFGKGEVLFDRNKAEELWTPALKAWFPDGVDDPNLALIRVQIERADYWEAPPSKVVQMFGFAKAILTGKPATGEEVGTHKSIELH